MRNKSAFETPLQCQAFELEGYHKGEQGEKTAGKGAGSVMQCDVHACL